MLSERTYGAWISRGATKPYGGNVKTALQDTEYGHPKEYSRGI